MGALAFLLHAHTWRIPSSRHHGPLRKGHLLYFGSAPPPPRPKPGLSSINPLRIFNFFLCQLLFLSPSLSLVPRCQALCWFPCSPASSTCTHNPYTCVSSPALGPEHTTGASTSPQTRALNKAYPELKFSWHPLLALYL